jgi:hypothetical protein
VRLFGGRDDRRSHANPCQPLMHAAASVAGLGGAVAVRLDYGEEGGPFCALLVLPASPGSHDNPCQPLPLVPSRAHRRMPLRSVCLLAFGRVLTASVTFWGLGKAARRKNTPELGLKSPVAFPSPQTVI